MDQVLALPTAVKALLAIIAFIGGGTVIGVAVKMIARPRLRLLYQPDLAEDAEVSIRYAGAVDQAEVKGQAFFVRALLWNYGYSTADDCFVPVDSVWYGDERISLFARPALKWTLKDSGAERFSPRRLLPGQANGIRVDVCKTDTASQSLQILSEASQALMGYHWYDKSGIYTIELIAQSSSFWATPARCTIAVQFTRTDAAIFLGVVGCDARVNLLKTL
jgi:hypothetical protein